MEGCPAQISDRNRGNLTAAYLSEKAAETGDTCRKEAGPEKDLPGKDPAGKGDA